MAERQKLVFTTDLSEQSFAAFPLALKLADSLGADLCVVSVVEKPYYLFTPGAPGSVEEILKEQAVHTRQRIELELTERAPKRDVEVVVVTAPKDAAEAIVEEATRRKACLIVMATHGRSGLPRWVLGSMTEKVIRHSPIPILCVPAADPPSRGELGP